MAYADLREYLKVVEAKGLLRRVKKEVDPAWETACIARWIVQAIPDRDRYGLFFEKVKGKDFPACTLVVGGSRSIYAVAMETTPEDIYEKWIRVTAKPIPHQEVSQGPSQEFCYDGDRVDVTRLPAFTWTPGKDAGPYLTANCVITKDPETGKHNVGNYRIQVKGPKKLGCQLFPNQHGGMHLAKWVKRGQKRMPIAIAIGVDPSLSLCATAKIPFNIDEYDVAGAIRGEPFPTVKAKLSDLRVPATAEFVLEGYVDSDEEELEGPFGEYVGYMGLPGPKRVIHVELMTHRRDPIYQAFLSQMPPSESLVLQQNPFAAIMYKHLKYDLGYERVKDVHFTDASGKTHVIVQMKPGYPGDSRKIMLIASGLLDCNGGKWVTIVDEDIDIRDPFLIEWAIASRVDPAKDIIIIPDAETTMLDPATTLEILTDGTSKTLKERLTGSKLLIDATIKRTYPAISLPTKEYMYKALDGWEETGLPPIQVPERTRRLLEHHPTGELYYEPYK